MSDDPRQWNLAKINAQADQILLRTQTKLEETIDLTAQAYGEYADAVALYRQQKAETIKELLDRKTAATVSGEIASGACANLKADMMRAEGQWQRARNLCRALEERLQTIKFIARRVDVCADRAQ